MMKQLKYSLIIGSFILLASCAKQPTTSVTIDSSESRVKETSKNPQVETSEQPSEGVDEAMTYQKGSLLNAVAGDDLVKVRTILEDKEYQIDETNSKGETPLLMAVHQNSIEIAKLLIARGADVNKQDNIKDSPYLFAGAEGRIEILTEIIANGKPDYQIYNRYGGNALIPAAEKGHIDNVRLLLKTGKEDVNHQNSPGYTALIEAVALNDGSKLYQDISKELLEHGADQSLRDNSGRTALDYAREYGYTEMIKLLN